MPIGMFKAVMSIGANAILPPILPPPEPLIFNYYLPTSQTFTGMATDGGSTWLRWNAGSTGGAFQYKSVDDRETWVLENLGGLGYSRLAYITFSQGVWYRVLDNLTSQGALIQKSTDASNWVTIDTITSSFAACSKILVVGSTLLIVGSYSRCLVSYDLGATQMQPVTMNKTQYSYYSDAAHDGTNWFITTAQSSPSSSTSTFGDVFMGTTLDNMVKITQLFNLPTGQSYRGVTASSGKVVVYCGVSKNSSPSGDAGKILTTGYDVIVSDNGGGSWTVQALGLNSGSTTPNINSVECDGFGRWVMVAVDGWSAYSFDNLATDWLPNARYLGATQSWQMGNLQAFDGGLWILSGEQESTPERSRISNDPNAA